MVKSGGRAGGASARLGAGDSEAAAVSNVLATNKVAAFTKWQAG
jgi:hypothetical protein